MEPYIVFPELIQPQPIISAEVGQWWWNGQIFCSGVVRVVDPDEDDDDDEDTVDEPIIIHT